MPTRLNRMKGLPEHAHSILHATRKCCPLCVCKHGLLRGYSSFKVPSHTSRHVWRPSMHSCVHSQHRPQRHNRPIRGKSQRYTCLHSAALSSINLSKPSNLSPPGYKHHYVLHSRVVAMFCAQLCTCPAMVPKGITAQSEANARGYLPVSSSTITVESLFQKLD